MKLLYCGSTFCDEPILKRLLVIADEIQFMNRPSVTFGNWGTIGHDSFANRVDSTGSPVRIRAVSPPSGPGEWLYEPYIEADLDSPAFANAVLNGIQTSDTFTNKFVQPKANYSKGVTGQNIIGALRADKNLLGERLDIESSGKNMFDVSTHENRRRTLNTIMVEASILVTSAVLVAEETGTLPVSEDPHFAKLIALRSSDSAYVGGTPRIAPYVGLDVAKAVIPDELLTQLEVPDILKYREKAKDAYTAWTVEINRAAASIGNVDADISPDEISRVITTELAPKLVEYRNEMCGIRDDLFADLIKKVATWEAPALSLAYLANLGFAGAITLFLTALAPTIPDAVDFFKDKREIERRNAMAFLIKLSKMA